MSGTRTMDRRGFMRNAAGRKPAPPLVLSCERLYVQYTDAVAADRLPEFLQALVSEIAAAGELRVVDREWLAREDFRAAVEPLLR